MSGHAMRDINTIPPILWLQGIFRLDHPSVPGGMGHLERPGMPVVGCGGKAHRQDGLVVPYRQPVVRIAAAKVKITARHALVHRVIARRDMRGEIEMSGMGCEAAMVGGNIQDG